MITRFIIASLLTGLLFAILDGLINGNPLAVKLMEPFKPIAKSELNIIAGIGIDLFYGFLISGIFIIIMPSLPSDSGLIKGIVYGLGIWAFRVLMSVASYWMIFKIPAQTLIYILITGLIEMILLGICNGLIIKK